MFRGWLAVYLCFFPVSFAQTRPVAAEANTSRSNQEFNFGDELVQGALSAPEGSLSLGRTASTDRELSCIEAAAIWSPEFRNPTYTAPIDVQDRLNHGMHTLLLCMNRCLNESAATWLTSCVLQESQSTRSFQWSACPRERVTAAILAGELRLDIPNPVHPEQCMSVQMPQGRRLMRTEVDRPTAISLIVDTSRSMIERGVMAVAEQVVQDVATTLQGIPGVHRILISSHALDDRRKEFCSASVGDQSCGHYGSEGILATSFGAPEGISTQPATVWQLSSRRPYLDGSSQVRLPNYLDFQSLSDAHQVPEVLQRTVDFDPSERHLLAYSLNHLPLIRSGENSIAVFLADEHDASDTMLWRSIRNRYPQIRSTQDAGMRFGGSESMSELHSWPLTRESRHHLFYEDGRDLLTLGSGELHFDQIFPDMTALILRNDIATLQQRGSRIQAMIPVLSPDLVSDLNTPFGRQSVWGLMSADRHIGSTPIPLDSHATQEIIRRIQRLLPPRWGQPYLLDSAALRGHAVTHVSVDGHTLLATQWSFNQATGALTIASAVNPDRSRPHWVEVRGVREDELLVGAYPSFLSKSDASLVPTTGYLYSLPLPRENGYSPERDAQSAEFARYLRSSISRAHLRTVWALMQSIDFTDQQAGNLYSAAFSQVPQAYWQLLLRRAGRWDLASRQELLGMLAIATALSAPEPARYSVALRALSGLGDAGLRETISQALRLRLINSWTPTGGRVH